MMYEGHEMGKVYPYITSSRKERTKIDSILSNNVHIDGLVIDVRRLRGPLRSGTEDIIHRVWAKNPNAVILVDPRTDAFQVERDTRINIRSLYRIYELAGLTSRDVRNDQNFTSQAIMQRLDEFINRLHNLIKSVTLQTTITDLTEDRVAYFIPPYFVSNSYNDEWYGLTLTAIQKSLNMIKDLKILAPVAVSKVFLGNRENIKRLIKDYKALDVSGYIILPYNVNDTAASRTVLENLAHLALALKQTNKFVVVAIAEFGNVLISLGVDALTFGICSHKAPYIPRLFEEGVAEIARTEDQLYIPAIFRKLHAEKVVKLLTLVPSAYQCLCPICSNYKDSYIDLLEEAGYADFSVHYVFWKNHEVEKYYNHPELLLRDLEKAEQIIQQYNVEVGEEYFYIEEAKYRYAIDRSYVDKWLSVLSTLLQSSSTNA